MSMYSVMNILSEYTYFYASKSITLYTFLLVFKIVKNFQSVFKNTYLLGHLWAVASEAKFCFYEISIFFFFFNIKLNKEADLGLLQHQRWSALW